MAPKGMNFFELFTITIISWTFQEMKLGRKDTIECSVMYISQNVLTHREGAAAQVQVHSVQSPYWATINLHLATNQTRTSTWRCQRKRVCQQDLIDYGSWQQLDTNRLLRTATRKTKDGWRRWLGNELVAGRRRHFTTVVIGRLLPPRITEWLCRV